MKTTHDIQHVGTLGTAHRTNMTFDANSISHLMSLLTDLYSNPTLAVIREYSTNAWDAHVRAGNTAPIEVSLPSSLTNMLLIKDYGVGMSVTDITDHFSKYGWSNKRDTDDENGMMGIGCKAGLTYTSQFTLVTIQNGVKATVLVTREESGGGVVQIIDTVSTDEPNGTEIQIPCKDHNDMREVALEYFKYWDHGMVLIDGIEPPCIWDGKVDGAIVLDPDIILIPQERHQGSGRRLTTRSQIVMGNVAYPIDESKLSYSLQQKLGYFYVVVRVPIGSVNFVPSREALSYTKRTVDTVDTALEFIFKQLHRVVQARIDATVNAKEAWQIWTNWRYIVGSGHNDPLKYQGSPLVSQLEVPDSARTLMMNVKAPYYSNDTDRSERIQYGVTLDRLYKCAFHVVGFNGTVIAASTKAKVRAYAESKGITTGSVLLYPKIFGAPWLTNQTVNRVRWDVIQAIKLPVDPDKVKAVTRQRFKYRILRHGSGVLQYLDKLPDDVVCWVPAVYNDVSRLDIAQFAVKSCVAVVLAADEKRFMRDNPTIPKWQDWIEKQIIETPLSGSNWDNLRYHAHQEANSWQSSNSRKRWIPQFFDTSVGYAKLATLILDPTLRRLLVEYKESDHSSNQFISRIAIAEQMNLKFKFVMPKVPLGTEYQEIQDIRAWYDGLLEFSVYAEAKNFIKALNAYYLTKSCLAILPVL